MILDTEFLISLRANEEAAVDLARKLEEEALPTRIPTVVIQELYAGVGAGTTPERNERAFEALIGNKPIVPLDEHVARHAGRLEGEHLTSDAKPSLGPVDAVVAATGLSASEPVVTNDGGFEHVDDLEVVLY